MKTTAEDMYSLIDYTRKLAMDSYKASIAGGVDPALKAELRAEYHALVRLQRMIDNQEKLTREAVAEFDERVATRMGE